MAGAAAIILAGGSGSRVDGETNKVYLPIAGRSMATYSLRTMIGSPLIDVVVMAIRAEDRTPASELIEGIGGSDLVRLVIGGASRHESEYAGIRSLAGEIEDGSIDLIVVHDGARPFMTHELLERVINAARDRAAAIPGNPVDGPLFRIGGSGLELCDHRSLRRIQTPQAFAAAPLLDAYQRADPAGFAGVDTSETVETFSSQIVTVVRGDERNLKVTFTSDFAIAEGHALRWERGHWTS